ncbi:MAG: cytochrome c biogenesis protein ResB [Bacteroidales bacterium]|nr:cytochrome c biogenesis protein ResB [Bacteroidales bacterium]
MIDINIFAYPSSMSLAALTLCAILTLGFCFPKSKAANWMTKPWISAALLAMLAGLCAVEGTWSLGLYHSAGFIAVVLMAILAIGTTCVKAFKDGRPAAFILVHSGIFLVLFGGFFGAADVRDGRMAVWSDEQAPPERLAIMENGKSFPLPFDIRLKEFRTDFYEDGISPKQYSSTLTIDGKELMTAVNHPCRYKGYWIYQSDYDHEYGRYSVLKVVRDPWLGVVFLGMILLAIAALMEVKKTWKGRWVIPVIVVLAAGFTALSLARINLGTMMPALRSLWFIPHVIIYMLAYSVMAVALVLGLIALFGRKGAEDAGRKMLATASSLLVLGMLCGAIWAKYAWGQYWTWDGKECWAAATWLLTLLGTHIPKKNARILVATALISFAAMQITWYGVNYLPSSQYSLHTYNSSR